MPAIDRRAGRTVHLYDGLDRTRELGGLEVTYGVTKLNFYEMVNILLDFDPPGFSIKDESSSVLERNQDPMLRGNFYVFGNYEPSQEVIVTRLPTTSGGSRLDSFRRAVRLRDGRCVICGEVVTRSIYDDWDSFEAAHIFPVAYQDIWVKLGFNNLITIPGGKGETINSVQNGMLLRADIHKLFDHYRFSINPKDNLKVIWFANFPKGLEGRYMDQEFRNAPDKPLYELRWWHYRQAVLYNMKAGGEPLFEHDFPPGSDMMGEIREGPKAAERMEFELFTRFAVQSPLEQEDDVHGDGRRDSVLG